MLKLTACITTFNRWHSCLNALESVCNQMKEGLEVILVDDCSSKAMPEEVNHFIKTNPVIYIRHETNQGLAGARNTAIEAASGQYFAFCDDDDAWPPNFALRLLSVLENSPSDVSMAVALPPILRRHWQQVFTDYPKLTDIILQGVTPPVSSQAYQTRILREVGGYDPKIKSGVDHDLWLSLAKIYPRVGVTWGEPAIVEDNPRSIRMTTAEEKRRAKVAEALTIWKPKIVEVFGDHFYLHFCQSYQQYVDYDFFIKSVKRGELLTAFKKVFNPHVLNKLPKHIFNKAIGRKPCHDFPKYQNQFMQ